MKAFAAALAGGITGVAISILCAALVGILPIGFMRSYSGSMFHGMNVNSLIVQPEFALLTLLLGFVYAFITGFAIGGVFALAYNWADKFLR